MAEGDSSSSFSDAETDSILSGSAYYSTEDSDASSVASLSLPVPEELARELADIRPYLFEPERSSSSESEETPEIDDRPGEERLGNTNWCTCGCCQTMPTPRESVCCQEIDEMKSLLIGDPVPPCITQHPSFTSACLDTVVLSIAYHGHRYHYGASDIPADENRKFRYLAYRQLTWWGWNYLGRNRRVVLPSCAVARIRNEFPSEDYTGHQHPPRTP